MKCEHERSIHLFIDSILHKDQPCVAFRCSNQRAFQKGVCLSCRKNRCNTLGYDATPVQTRKASQMFLKTRAEMPFRGRPGEGLFSELDLVGGLSPRLAVVRSHSTVGHGRITIRRRPWWVSL